MTRKSLNYSTLIVAIFDAILQFLSTTALLFSLQQAVVSNFNQGIITSLFSIQNIILLIFGITIFNERVNYLHLFGIVLMFSCAVLIGISDNGLERDKIKVLDFVVD